MAIDFSRPGNTQGPATSVSGTQAGVQNKTGSPASQPAASSDSVQLSDSARLLQGMTSKLADMPVVNEERVQQLQQAIADGHYPIDSLQLADKMVRFETEF